MQKAELTFINEPYYMISIPEYKDEHNLDLHLFRYDIPGKGWKSMNLRYSKEGIIPVKEAVGTSHMVVHHSDPDATFKIQEEKHLKIEKNLFQIKDETIVDNVKYVLINDVNKILQNNFTLKVYSLEEFEKLLEESDDSISKDTLSAFRDTKDSSCRRNIAAYYLLYTMGGVYLDSKAMLKRSLEDIYFRLNLYDGFITLYDSSNGIPDAEFIACKKGSTMIKAVLEKAIRNVMDRHYGKYPQEPTGNLCLYECTGKILPTMRELRYEDEKYFILKQESGRLYDENNRLVWNHDVFINSLDKKTSPNLWLHCGLYANGNCSNFSNWKFYMGQSVETQSAVLVLSLIIIAIVAFYIFNKFQTRS